MAQGVLEWKRLYNVRHIGLDVQAWLDRFYMSRIGIRFLIGQRRCWFIVMLLNLDTPSGEIDIALNTLPSHPAYVGIICTDSVSNTKL